MPIFGPRWGEQVYEQLLRVYALGDQQYGPSPSHQATVAGVKAACALAGFDADSLRHTHEKATVAVSRPLPTLAHVRLAQGGGLLVLAHVIETFGDFDFWSNYDQFGRCAWLTVTDAGMSPLLALKPLLTWAGYERTLHDLYRRNTTIESRPGRLQLEEMRAVLAMVKWLADLVHAIANRSDRLPAIPGCSIASNAATRGQLARQVTDGLEALERGLSTFLPSAYDLERVRPLSFDQLWPQIARSVEERIYPQYQDRFKALLRTGPGRFYVDNFVALCNLPETVVDRTTWGVLTQLIAPCASLPRRLTAVDERLAFDIQIAVEQITNDMKRCGTA